VLSDLEECLYYLAGEPVVDVYRLTELVFDRVRVETPEESKHIISINEVTRDMVDSDLAAKAALIIAELVLNATLHAFDGDSPAQFIHVKFSRSALGDEHGDYWTLRVSDNGSGFLTDTTPDPTAYSGLGLVAYLTEQLGGTLKCHNEEGATVSIQIPGAYSA
jgi:two-component sensor histidine kinase